MKILGLISGGKDSICNLIECVNKGHEIVALANLYNKNEQFEGEELNSYMYQTVGTNITLAIAQAMGKPIYRRQIQGKPKIITLEYEGDYDLQKEGDEVEDLDLLVQQVIKNHPEINAISSGAIYSTYQKLRVENICKRYGLTSLAFLWHRDQKQLIRMMINCQIDAVIIKVASYGLKREHLGKSIAELQGYFLKLEGQCGMNVCGEGGEYESLVLNCPLFSKKIIIDQFEIIDLDKNEIAPVAYLRINKVKLVEK